MQKAIILPIKGIYVNRILQGQKKYEFRKRLCKNDIDWIYVYETAPVKKVVCRIEVKAKLMNEKEELWNVTQKYAGIEKEKYDKYFLNQKLGCAYELGKVQKLEPQRELMEFGINFIPQSYVYLQDEIDDLYSSIFGD